MSHYLFDSAAAQAAGRFSALESCYDPVSRRQLELTGLATGWRCLEVGGGSASLGDWLGERVGPRGEVTVTELEPRWAASRHRPDHVRLLRHDIVHDPLPGMDYDLVHARLVLLHLPERLEVLEKLVAALRPGGWLVLGRGQKEHGVTLLRSGPNSGCRARRPRLSGRRSQPGERLPPPSRLPCGK
ncbi:class I SAM-dependent methyltransferase [Streptomyces hokutonensis]|uniref:class I SAM-dependent methyltransferase n=1 Tax=Streptomyces hokutonensis TaxID=1306990 RepID=UPI0033DC60AA